MMFILPVENDPSRAIQYIVLFQRGRNSVGRVSAFHAECRRFEPDRPLLVDKGLRQSDVNPFFVCDHLCALSPYA